MNRSIVLASGLVFAVIFAPSSDARGLGGTAGELISARANARAGGPLSPRDKELLSQYGCLSGTKHEFCQPRSYKKKKRYYRKRSKR